MTEKRFTCETKTQGCVSIDLMKDNGQIIEKFEAINLLNEQHETITDLEEKEIELGRNYLIKLEFEQKVKDTLQKEIYNINETIFNINNQIDDESARFRLNDKYESQKEILEKIVKELGIELQ